MNEHLSEKSSLGFTGKLTKLFLENKEISLLSLIILTVWGSLSFLFMPKQYNPEIVAPAFTIITEMPNASAQEIHDIITKPMEDALSEIVGVNTLSSLSKPGGVSLVTVQFFVGYNQEEAKITLQQKLNDRKHLKPSSAKEPLIQSIDPDNVPILDIAVFSPELSLSSLRQTAWDIADKLKHVEGVSDIEIVGGEVSHLRIVLDADKLSAYDITAQDIMRSINNKNGFSTFDALNGAYRDSVISLKSTVLDVNNLAGTIIKKEGDAIVRLSDVASLSHEPDQIRQYTRTREKNTPSKDVVHIAIAKHKGANSTLVAKNVEKKLATLEQGVIPEMVSVEILNNEGKTANDEISKLTIDLVKSILIVGVLLFIFLGLKNSLIAAISIPLVLLAVFGIGLLADQSVNRITLFALILSLGLLVDDAIVVVENIARYFRLHPEENNTMNLIIRAVDEVGGALSLSTLTMALAFLPMAFVTGMMGPYMGPIPFFVPVALFASLLISVTLNPFLAHVFLSKKSASLKHDYSYENGTFYKLIQKVEAIYAKTLNSLLQKRKKRNMFLASIAILLLVSFVLPLTPSLPFRMLPKANKDQFSIYVDLPEKTNLEQTKKATLALEEVLLQDKEIIKVESFVGIAPVVDFNGLFKGSSGRMESHQATLKIHLTPHEERTETSESIAKRTRLMAHEFRKTYPDVQVQIMEDPPGPPVLATFFLKIKGDETQTRENIARDILQKVKEIEGVVDIQSSLPEEGLDFVYEIDQEKSFQLGVRPQEAIEALHTALSGTSIGLYHETLRENQVKHEQEHILIRYHEKDRDSKEDLEKIRVRNTRGESVPLTALIKKSENPISLTLLSDERETVTYIGAEMEDRSVIYAVLDFFSILKNYQLPDGKGEISESSLFGFTYSDTQGKGEYKIEIDGEWKLTLEVFRDLGIAMGLALFLIYFVLAAKIKSLFIPLLVMVSIPLSFIGVLPGFALLWTLKGTYFNATSMIGVIALSGLAVKNAVIYMEYLEPLRQQRKPLIEALVETGRIRLLPILLTSLAAILGSLTIVSDPVWEGLAWALIFGLTASTFLTLLVFPVLYFLFQKNKWDES